MLGLRPSSYENEICGTGHWLRLRRLWQLRWRWRCLCDASAMVTAALLFMADCGRWPAADDGRRMADQGRGTADNQQPATELNHWTSCQPQTFGIVYRTATTTAKGFLGSLRCGRAFGFWYAEELARSGMEWSGVGWPVGRGAGAGARGWISFLCAMRHFDTKAQMHIKNAYPRAATKTQVKFRQRKHWNMQRDIPLIA